MVLCGDTVCGVDTDDAFAYTTQKVVWIRDRWIGFFYYCLILLVLLWIVGWQILWENDHFMLKDVQGMPRMWLSHPTEDNCEPGDAGCKSNFRKLVDLPYCDVYQGKEKYAKQAHCEYKDRITLQDTGSRIQSVFIPTAVELVTEKRHCFPDATNGYSCDNVYETLPGSDCLRDGFLCKTRNNRSKQFYYVADIANFVIRFTSSYERGDIRGTSLMHQGYVGVCRKLLNLANTTQTWSDRKENAKHKCTEQEFEMYKLPCKSGIDCSKVTSFDSLEEKGVSVAGRHLQQVISKHVNDHFSLMDPEAAEAFAQVGASAHGPGGHHHHERRGPASARHARLRHRVADEAQGHLSAMIEEPPKFLPDEDPAAAPSPALASVEAGESEAAAGPAAGGAASALPDMYRDNWGDVFKVRQLLQLAGADLDRNFNMDGWTAREAGTVLEVQAVYNNLHPLISSFGYKPVSYHYTVRQLTIPYVNRLKLSAVQPDDYPNTRNYEVQYGILIYFKVSGSFGFFSIVYLIVMLTAAFALTASATTVTDFVGLYLHPRRKNYFHLKYQVSSDFSDTWECPKCHYHNKPHQAFCQGHDKWTCPEDIAPCGAPRPEAPRPET